MLILGDNNSGKTLFCKQLTNRDISNKKYEHTISLDIYKTLITYQNKKIQIELFDTNEKIMNANIFKIYYQFSHAILYFVNIDNINKDSLYFNKLKNKIINIQHDTMNALKIAIAINIYGFKNISKKVQNYIIKNLRDLAQHLNIGILNLNLDNFSINCDDFKDYINSVLIKKCLSKSI